MNVFAKFDEIPSMTLQDIREQNVTDTSSFGRTDNVKTVYPPTNTVCGEYYYDALEFPMLHTKLQGNKSIIYREEDF